MAPTLIDPLIDAQQPSDHWLFVGPESVANFISADVNKVDHPAFDHSVEWLCCASEYPSSVADGQPSAASGQLAMDSLKRAVKVINEQTSGGCLLTLPLSKQYVQAAGYEDFVGHTEYLEDQFDTRGVMSFWGDDLNVALATRHIALSDVPDTLTKTKLRDTIGRIHNHYERFSRLAPSIAVLGLNPHAGEGGLIGHEDEKLISPVVRDCSNQGIDVEGPFPADGFLPTSAGQYDIVLAQYHDQGLAPFKLNHFFSGVHATLGLKVLRASPVHGTAFDLMPNGQVDPTSALNSVDWLRNWTANDLP